MPNDLGQTTNVPMLAASAMWPMLPASALPNQLGHSDRRAASHSLSRWTWAIAALTLFAAAGCAAYWQLYSSFARYDDEGYVLLSLRTFQAGHPLYDETATQYGPAYFFVQDALHRLLRLPVTHDVARLKTLLTWLAAAVIAGWIMYRITGDWVVLPASKYLDCWLALIAGLGTLHHLDRLGLEPGHPQDQALWLLLAVLALSLWEPLTAAGHRWRAAALGVLTGVLAMTKLNLGVLTGLACAGALLLDATRQPLTTWLWRLTALAGLSLPLVLARNHLLSWDGAALPASLVAGWCGVLLTQHPWGRFSTCPSQRSRHGDSPDFALERHSSSARLVDYAPSRTMSWTGQVGNLPHRGLPPLSVWLFAALLSTGVLYAGALLDGTSPAGLWHGLVGQHRGFLDLFYQHPPLPRESLLFAALGVALAIWSRRDGRAVAMAQWLSLALLLTVGLQVFCESFRPIEHGLDDRAAAGWLAACVPALSWALLVRGGVAAVQTDGGDGQRSSSLMPAASATWPMLPASAIGPASGESSFVRRMLCLFTIVQPLAAYPTPGTQLAIGTLPALLTVVVLSGELLRRLWAGSSAAASSVGHCLRGLAAIAVLTLVCRDVTAWRQWSGATPLALPGAEYLRLPAEEAASRRRVVQYLRTNADAFVASPTGCCSFYLWSGLAPPTTRNVTFWEVLQTEREQRDVIAVLEAARRPCVLVDRRQSPVKYIDAPLHCYLEERFTQVVVDGEFELRTPGVVVSASEDRGAVE